tara:strand:+ start:29902 stop:30195 length:294 start_codon:yes stop_codon:yes gene_type:complete
MDKTINGDINHYPGGFDVVAQITTFSYPISFEFDIDKEAMELNVIVTYDENKEEEKVLTSITFEGHGSNCEGLEDFDLLIEDKISELELTAEDERLI